MEEIVVVVQEEKLIPQERVQQRTVDYVSAPQFRKEAVGVVLAPTARGHHWIAEQIVEWERLVDVPVPKTPEREVVIFGPARTREITQRQVFVDTPAPETLKELDEVVILVQQEYMQRQTDKHFNILVLVILKDIVEVVSLVPQENVQRQTEGCFVASPVPSILTRPWRCACNIRPFCPCLCSSRLERGP